MDFLVEGFFFGSRTETGFAATFIFFFVEVCIALARTQGLIKKKNPHTFESS